MVHTLHVKQGIMNILTSVLATVFFFKHTHTHIYIVIVDTKQIQTTCKLGIMNVLLPVCLDFLILPFSDTLTDAYRKHTGPRRHWSVLKKASHVHSFPCLNLGRAGIHHRIKPVSHQTQESVANAISLSHCLT